MTWVSYRGTNCQQRSVAPTFSGFVCPSIRVEQHCSHWMDFCEIWFENLSRKFRFHYNLTRITGNLHEDLCTFLIIFSWILLIMRNLSDKSCRENQNISFIFPKIVPFMRQSGKKYIRVRHATDDNITWCMHFVCWIPRATDTHSEYVILTALPQQQRVHKLSLMLYVHSLSYLYCNWSSNLTENCWVSTTKSICLTLNLLAPTTVGAHINP